MFVDIAKIGENCKNRLFAYENIDNYTTHISNIVGDIFYHNKTNIFIFNNAFAINNKDCNNNERYNFNE